MAEEAKNPPTSNLGNLGAELDSALTTLESVLGAASHAVAGIRDTLPQIAALGEVVAELETAMSNAYRHLSAPVRPAETPPTPTMLRPVPPSEPEPETIESTAPLPEAAQPIETAPAPETAPLSEPEPALEAESAQPVPTIASPETAQPIETAPAPEAAPLSEPAPATEAESAQPVPTIASPETAPLSEPAPAPEASLASPEATPSAEAEPEPATEAESAQPVPTIASPEATPSAEAEPEPEAESDQPVPTIASPEAAPSAEAEPAPEAESDQPVPTIASPEAAPLSEPEPAPEAESAQPEPTIASPEAAPSATLSEGALDSPASDSLQLSISATSGSLDLKAVDRSINENPAVVDVTLLDYDGRNATLKIWTTETADPASVKEALLESFRRNFGDGQDTEISIDLEGKQA